MTTPTREQVIADMQSIGVPDLWLATLTDRAFEFIAKAAEHYTTAGRDQGLREAGYPADFEPVEFLVGVEMWVKAAYQRVGARKWKIARGFDEVLNKKGQWEDEPIPSSRTDDFLARCRFDSLEECADAIRAMKEQA